MKLYYPITIDLYKVYPLQVMEAQQGNVGRGAIVTLTAGGAVVDPTNEDVEVYAKKPDGTVSWLECSVEDAKVKMDFTNQMLMSPGVLQVELRIKNETDDITTPIFMVQVNKSNVQNAGRSENELPLLDQIKKNADDAKAAAEAAEKAVGDKITNPNVGTVGQILEIETVDEKGKPLTYKAVDKPEGGVDEELSQIIHESKYGIVSDGVNDTVIVVGKDAAAGDVIRYIITENSGDITVIYDNGDTGEFNISSISHAGEEAGEKTLTAEKYCTYTFPSEIDVYLPFNIPSRISQLADDVGVAKQHEVSKLSEDIATKASAIKEKASGETIVVTDSDEAKPLGLAIDGKSEQNQYSGKNFLKLSPRTVSGDVEWEIKDNNHIIGSGVPTAYNSFPLTDIIEIPIDKGEYTFSLFGTSENASLVINLIGENKEQITDVYAENSVSVDLSKYENAKYWSFQIKRSENNVAVNVDGYVQLEKGAVTEYEPYVGGKPSPSPEYKQEIRNIGVYDEASGKYAVEVKGTKKNLINQNCVPGGKGSKHWLKSGIYTVSRDLSEIAVGNTWYLKAIDKNNNFITERAFVLSGYNPTAYNLSGSGEWYFGGDGRISCTFELKEDCFVIFGSLNGSGNTYLQLEYGTVATPIETHKETTATVLLDEPLRKGDKAYWNGKKLLVERNAFYGRIISDLDWKYSTSTNRFWAEDYRFEKGKAGNVTPNALCNMFIVMPQQNNITDLAFSYVNDIVNGYAFRHSALNGDINTWKQFLDENEVYVCGEANEPTTEEIDIDLDLSMFYPTTILSNDCNANMEVTYIADTKAYIDKKFAELATAMV